MVGFINDHREAYGVESICRVVPIAPSTYFRHRARQLDPTKRSARAVRDEVVKAIIQRIWHEHDQAYGSRKVWKQMGREGLREARCRVRRLMRELGLVGVVRGRAWTTTTQPDAGAPRPADLVDRRFVATRPNQLWVSDFTYVATWAGFVYVAFVIDVFARRIVGWRVSASLRTDFVLGRWHVANGREQPSVIEPIYPRERREFDRLKRSPRAFAANHFGLEEPDD